MFSMLRVSKGFDLTTGASQDNTNDAWNILSNYQWTMEDAMKMIRKSGERREGEMEREGGRERERGKSHCIRIYLYQATLECVRNAVGHTSVASEALTQLMSNITTSTKM